MTHEPTALNIEKLRQNNYSPLPKKAS
jgi:hypothetical protein